MGQYEKLDKQGKPKGRLSQTDMPMEGGGSRYVQDTPTFESLVTNAGQGTRGDKTFKIGAQEYDRPRSESNKKSSSEKPPAGIRAELDAMEQDKMNAKGMKVHEGRKLAKGGKIDGCAQRGKTRGRMV
jgi:hypothetical protein